MKSNTISFIIITLVLVAGAYWYFFTGTGNQPPLTSSPVSRNAMETQFQALVNELQTISFNTAIFSDPRFTSLVNLMVPVAPEPSGRLDPFAPIIGVTGI